MYSVHLLRVAVALEGWCRFFYCGSFGVVIQDAYGLLLSVLAFLVQRNAFLLRDRGANDS